MRTTSARDRRVLELVKNREHFLVVYPESPAGRLAAKGAVRDWLTGRELDFDRHDADLFWKAIDGGRFQAVFDRYSRNGRATE